MVSDVHCQHEALRAAVDALLADGVDEILLAGDLHYEYRFSNEVVAIVREVGIRCVSGNHDAGVLRSRAVDAPTVAAADLAFQRQIPHRLSTAVGDKRLTMVHANPFAPDYAYLDADDPVFDRCDELGADYLVLGHTHVPRASRHGRTLVINPGSLTFSRDADGYGRLTYAVLDTTTDEVVLVRDGQRRSLEV